MSGKSAISIDLSRCSILSFGKTTDLDSLSRFELTVMYFWINFVLNYLLFCSLSRNRDWTKTRRVHLIFIFRRSLNSNFWKTTGLNSSERISVDLILSEFSFLSRLIWCMFHQSYLRPLTENMAVRLLLLLNMEWKLFIEHSVPIAQ